MTLNTFKFNCLTLLHDNFVKF